MPQDQDDIKGADAMKQAPTPGPLSGDDVKLLVKGDLLRLDKPAGPLNARGDLFTFTQPTPLRDHAVDVQKVGEIVSVSWHISRLTFIGRPGADGWMPWSGGENPVPGQRVELQLPSGITSGVYASEEIEWLNHRFRRFRLAPTAPVEASGSERVVGTIAHVSNGRAELPEMIAAALRPQPSGETREIARWDICNGGVTEDFEVQADPTGEWVKYADVEALLSLSLTPARAEALDEGGAGEPVAGWRYRRKGRSDTRWTLCDGEPRIRDTHDVQPLYAHPSSTPAADADRVRIAVEAMMATIGRATCPMPMFTLNAGFPEAHQAVTEALAALKSEGK